MTYWEQRAVTEKLIAKRKARKPKAKVPVSGWTPPYLHPQPAQWVGVKDNPLERLNNREAAFTDSLELDRLELRYEIARSTQ